MPLNTVTPKPETATDEDKVLPKTHPMGTPSSQGQTKGDSARIHALLFRHWIQIILFGITVAIGIQFAIFAHQAEHLSQVTVQRPPAVEGFLPIGALMGWKLFFATGIKNSTHQYGRLP